MLVRALKVETSYVEWFSSVFHHLVGLLLINILAPNDAHSLFNFMPSFVSELFATVKLSYQFLLP